MRVERGHEDFAVSASFPTTRCQCIDLANYFYAGKLVGENDGEVHS